MGLQHGPHVHEFLGNTARNIMDLMDWDQKAMLWANLGAMLEKELNEAGH
jgi:hypothetical protein